MGFKTDGSSHHNGIRNEKDIVDFINNHSISIKSCLIGGGNMEENRIIHRGGTQTKSDIEIVDSANIVVKTISVKNHKQGSFDWCNSTKYLNKYVNVDKIKMMKDRLVEIQEKFKANETNIDKVRREVEDLLGDILHNGIMHAEIMGILQGAYENNCDVILVNDVKSDEIVYFERDKLEELKTFEYYVYYLKKTRAKTSAQIWRKSIETGDEINTHLRIRLTLNNGVNALLGLSDKNKISVPSLKLQQDKVDLLLKNPKNIREKCENIVLPVDSTTSTST